MLILQRPRVVIALALIVGTLLVAVTVAVAAIPDADGVIHGCIKPNGVVRVINYPTKLCASGEKPLDWNQTGPQGPPAPPPIIVVNPARVDFATDGAWRPLPSASATVDVTKVPTTALVRWWASPACSGLSSRDKYARIVADGQQIATVPIDSIPPYTTAQSEIPVMIETSTVFTTAGHHTVGVDVLVASNGACAINPGLWHLVIQMF